MDINTLISKAILGTIDAPELEELESRMQQDPELCKRYQQLLRRRDFSQRYTEWASVDKEGAKRAYFAHRRSVQRQRVVRMVAKTVVGIAAAAALVFVLSTILQAHHPEPPVLSQAVEQAINRSQHSGQSEAMLTISGSKAVSVTTDSTVHALAKSFAESKQTNEDDEALTLSTSHAKEFWMTLEDGTRVHLNYSSSLTYPLHFDGKERRVRLHGEAYFFVAHDSKRKFIVETPGGVVTDYGTEFDVSTTPHGRTQVVLVKGKVGVSPRGGSETMMAVGTKAVFEAGKSAQLSKADVAPYQAWNTGQYYFDGSTLEQLMAVVAKWYGVDVDFVNESARKIRFTGSLDKYESPKPTLHAISTITGQNIEIEGKRVVIK